MAGNRCIQSVRFCFPPVNGREEGKIKQKNTTKLLWERLSALSIFSSAECSKSIYFCDFLPARKSASVKCCCFSLWPCDAALSEGCWDALFILGPLNLRAVSRCWGIDRAQWWTGSVSPAANQKVNSLSIEEGKWPPGLQPAHLSATQMQLLLTLSACITERRPAPHVSVNSNSLIRCLPSPNFFGELLQPSLTLETRDWIKFSLQEKCYSV